MRLKILKNKMLMLRYENELCQRYLLLKLMPIPAIYKNAVNREHSVATSNRSSSPCGCDKFLRASLHTLSSSSTSRWTTSAGCSTTPQLARGPTDWPKLPVCTASLHSEGHNRHQETRVCHMIITHTKEATQLNQFSTTVTSLIKLDLET